MLKILTTICLALVLAGCQTMLQFAADTAGVDVVSKSVRQQAYKAAKVTFVAWSGAPPPGCLVEPPTLSAEECIGGIQELIYKYGKLKPCDNISSIICRNQEAWEKIQMVEATTTRLLQNSEPLIEAGDDDVKLLMSLPAIVHDAKATIDASLYGSK